MKTGEQRRVPIATLAAELCDLAAKGASPKGAPPRVSR